MTANAPRAVPDARETSVEELTGLFQAQREAFRADCYPPYAERIEALRALEAMVKRHRRRIEEALRADFGTHPPALTAFGELLGPIERARYARRHLKRWMKPQPRALNRLVYGLSRACVEYQPLGVVGNIAPWNFPIELTLGPLVDMLAAGNRVILKPSELAPASAEVVKEMIAATYARDRVAVVTGGAGLAQAFARLPWDHLLYTGSTAVGRLVAQAAAENLTPVTLELGGKCPAIVCADSVDEATVASILATKAIKGGQMCVTADYVFVPEAQRDRFVALARAAMARMLPSYPTNPDATGIISDRHLDRLQSYIDDARRRGAPVIELSGTETNRRERKPPFTLVLDPADDAEVMRHEIFGPILPVRSYRTLEEVTAYVNARERPLALYLYTRDRALAERLLRQTVSGGAAVNAAAVQVAVPSLPFGGSGASGMGRYHGFEGFVTFSNARSVFRAGLGYNARLLHPPYGRTLERLLGWLLR